MPYGIIDRFEDDVAVLETKDNFIEIDRSLLPDDAGEGDVIDLKTYKIDRVKSKHRLTRIQRMARDVWEDD